MGYNVNYIVNGQPVTKEELSEVKITNSLFLSFIKDVRNELNSQTGDEKSEVGSCVLSA